MTSHKEVTIQILRYATEGKPSFGFTISFLGDIYKQDCIYPSMIEAHTVARNIKLRLYRNMRRSLKKEMTKLATA